MTIIPPCTQGMDRGCTWNAPHTWKYDTITRDKLPGFPALFRAKSESGTLLHSIERPHVPHRIGRSHRGRGALL